MERDPADYSRLLVFAGLVPLLAADLAGALPEWGFLVGGGAVLVIAGGIHAYGEERRAAAGWALFGAALGLAGFVDVMAQTESFLAFLALLVAGLLSLASEHSIATDTQTD
jgi:hypothetical protein